MTTGHQLFEDWVCARALGVLPEENQAELEKHLQGCALCQKLSADLGAVGDALLYSVRPQDPPKAVKERLMSLIRKAEPSSAISLAGVRRLLPFGLAALFFVGFAFWFFYAKNPDPVLVSHLQGRINIDHSPAFEGELLRGKGEVLATLDGASAEIRFSNRAIFLIKGNSEAVIYQDKSKIRVQLRKGWMESLVRKGNSYQVETSLATTSALGTAFFTQVDPDGKVYICICHGKIKVDSSDFHEELQAEHHLEILVQRAGGKIALNTVPMAFHTNEDMNTLADHFR